MRKIWTPLLILIVLALDWAALHDIIRGEPNPWLEWAFVLTSAAFFGVFIYRRLRDSRRT